MTFEVRAALLVILFAVWGVLGMFPWIATALLRRGEGVLLSLPLAIVGGTAGGVLVPVVGLRDEHGFLLSLLTASLGGFFFSTIGIALTDRFVTR